MGFFFNQSRGEAAKRKSSGAGKHIPIESMNKLGCRACPRDKTESRSKVEPEGPQRPLIYILGEMPTVAEHASSKSPIDGRAGKLLRDQFDWETLKKDVRISNMVRCGSDTFRLPELAEIECCRNLGIQDIEETKPLVVVGLGNSPLKWATGLSAGASSYRGRLVATKIGNHRCWFMSSLDPSWVLSKQGKYKNKSEYEKAFEHDFKWLLKIIPDEPPRIFEAPFDKGINYVTGQSGGDFAKLEEALHGLLSEAKVGIDLETTGLRPYGSGSLIHMAAVGTFDNTVVFPIEHPEGWSSLYKSKVRGLFGEFLMQSGRKIAHNLAFEMEWLGFFYGDQLLRLTEWEDTLAMAHTLYETPGTNSLDSLCREYFGFFLKDQSPIDLKHKQITDYPLMTALRYNALDTKWTWLLEKELQKKIQSNKKYSDEYERKVRLAPTLVTTQLKGVPVDFDYVAMMKTTLDKEISSIEGKISRCPEVVQYSKKFGVFEPTAPDQVLKLMRDICKREEVKKEGGGETTDEGALSSIPVDEVPSAPLILEHRAASKLTSTYIDPLVSKKLVGADGCLHTSYSSMIAVTGRLASQDPNLQNFPKRKRREIRGVIAAPEGYWIVASDYGQIEARVFGMASEDKNLVKYLWTGYDIHGEWADRFMKGHGKVKDRIIKDYGVNGDDTKAIRKKFRDEIKNGWVFPQFFGASTFSCASSLKVPEDVAKRLGVEFWDEFQGVKKWQDKLMQFYDKHLYVETLSGRRRRGAMSKNEILNMPIQGTAADIVLAAMNAVSEMSQINDDPEWCPNLNIHDDLTFLMRDERLDSEIPKIATEMCRHRFDFINVPLIVEVQVGKRWHELEEIGVYRSNELFNLSSSHA